MKKEAFNNFILTNSRKSQISMEYVVIMGFVTFTLVVIINASYIYSNLMKDSIKSNQLENCMNKILSTSESIFYAGYPSKATIKCYIPENIKSIEISEDNGNYFIYVTITKSTGQEIRGFRSEVPITGNLKNIFGIRTIKIQTQENNIVLIQD